MFLRFLEQYILARHFGPSRVLDAYFVAQITVLIGVQLALAVTSAAVPVLTSRAKSSNDLQGATFTVLVCVFLGSTALAIAVTLAAPLVVAVLGSGLSAQTDKLAQALLRCYVPAALLYIVAAVLRAYWHVHQNLLTPAILQPLIPFGSACAALLVTFNFVRIEWVPLGSAMGALVCVAILAKPFLTDARLCSGLWNSRVAREFRNALFPVTLSMVLIPCMIAIGRLFASRLSPGSVSALSIAASLMSIPGQIAATSVGTAVLPRASSLFVGSEHAQVAALVERGLRVTIFCSMPFSVALGLYPATILETVFHGSSFGPNAVALTSHALLGYCIGIPALGVIQVLVFVFFASAAWRQVARVTILSVVINLVFTAFLSRSLFGLAMAFSLSCCAAAGILMLVLNLHVLRLSISNLFISAGKSLGASLAGFAAVYLLRCYLLSLHIVAPMILMLLLGFASYIVLAAVVCKPEMYEVLSVLRPNRALPVANARDQATLVRGAQ